MLYLCFSSSCSKHRSLLSYLGVAGQVDGFSVQSVSWPCWPLSGPIENPQALKTFSLHCFHWLRPYLNTLHTPTRPERNANRSYGVTWNCSDFYSSILVSTWLGARHVGHFDPSYDWLEIHPGRVCDWAVARPQGASATVVTHVPLAWNQCFLCLK